MKQTVNIEQAITLVLKLNLDGNCQQTGRKALCRDSTFLTIADALGR